MSKHFNLRNLLGAIVGCSIFSVLFLIGTKIGQYLARKEEKEDVKKRSFRKYILIRRNEESN